MSAHTHGIIQSGQIAASENSCRIHRSLTASMEKRTLVWMAQRTPRWVTSDQLTLLGFAAQVVAGLGYAFARYDRRILWLVIACIALNWLGDSLDGTLARVRQKQRPRYGFYVDHVVDCFGAVALMSGMACSGLIHPAIDISMLIAFLLLSAESYLATHTLGRFEMAHGWFGPTEIRLLLILGNLELLRSPYSILLGHRWLLFDAGGVIATAGMSVMAVAITVKHIAQISREEPLP